MDTIAASTPAIRPVDNPTKSFWLDFEKDLFYKDDSVSFEETYDTVVIGAGMSGLSTAYWIASQAATQGTKIIVVDARGISEGATGRNGGHLWPNNLVGSDDDATEKTFGVDEINEIQRQYLCINMMTDFMKVHNIECDYVLTGAAVCARYNAEVETFKQLHAALVASNLNTSNVSVLSAEDSREKLKTSYIKGGFFQPVAGQFWPAKFCYGVAKAAHKLGVRYSLHNEVKQVHQTGDNKLFFVETAKGTFRTNKLVYATNGYTGGLVPDLKDWIVPVRGQVIATKPGMPTVLPFNIALNDGYEYAIQRQSDGRIIFGGCRWQSSGEHKEVGNADDSKVDPQVSRGLRECISDMWEKEGLKGSWPKGEDVPVDYEWTGVMGYTKDKKPLVGPLKRKGEYVIAGFHGNGMPQCFACAKALADMIIQDTDGTITITIGTRAKRQSNPLEGAGEEFPLLLPNRFELRPDLRDAPVPE